MHFLWSRELNRIYRSTPNQNFSFLRQYFSVLINDLQKNRWSLDNFLWWFLWISIFLCFCVSGEFFEISGERVRIRKLMLPSLRRHHAHALPVSQSATRIFGNESPWRAHKNNATTSSKNHAELETQQKHAPPPPPITTKKLNLNQEKKIIKLFFNLRSK